MDFSRKGLDPEPEVEQPDPLDRYFDPRRGSGGSSPTVGRSASDCLGLLKLPGSCPRRRGRHDLGLHRDGITDDDDNPITDYHSFVLWKGL